MSTPIAKIADDLYSDSIPQPSEHAIAAEVADEKAKADQLPAGFDPAIHETDSLGKPVLTPTGRFKKLSRNRKEVNPHRKINSTLGGVTQGKQETGQGVPNFAAVGQGMAETLFTIGRTLGGEEWAPIKRDDLGIDERAAMSDAFTSYAKSKNLKDIPPGIMLTIVILGYAGPRFAMKQTQSRMAKVREWFRNLRKPKEPIVE